VTAWLSSRENALPQLASEGGGALVATKRSETGAVSRSVQSKLRDEISVLDFGATGDGATSDTTAFTNAAAAAGNGQVIVPYSASGYNVADTVVAGSATFVLHGPGQLAGSAVESDLNAVTVVSGSVAGMPLAENLRGSRIEIIAGTLRQNGNQTVTSITRSGSTATATQTAHGYSNGDLVYIRGANETEYNVSGVAVSNVTANTYDYAVSGSPATPATGTLLAAVPKYWDWISDANHVPVGVDGSISAEAVTSTLTINFSKTYSRVISFIAAPDETLANALNLCIGQSVGLSSVALKASVNLTLAAHVWYDGADWQWSYGAGQGGAGSHNVEIESVTFPSNGNVSITHSFCPGIDAVVLPFSNNGAVAPYVPVIRAVSDSVIQVNYHDTSTGALRLDSTPNTSHAMHVRKNFSEGIRLDGSADSFELDLSLGNIWIYGIFEV